MIALDMLVKRLKVTHQAIIYIVLIYIVFCMGVIHAENDNLVIEIDNPKFSEKGLDDKIYEIKAQKGLKSNDDLELFVVEGKFKSNNDGKWVYLYADKGNYIQSLNIINLYENVKFYTDENEVIKSRYASYDITNDVIQFSENVRHERTNLLILSDNSVIMNNFKFILYDGNVSSKMKID